MAKNRYLRELPKWPVGTPLPASGLLLFYDFGTDKEYSILPEQVRGGGNGGGAGTVTSVNGITPDNAGNVVLPQRDPYAIGDNATVTAAIKAAGHTWDKGDLIAFANSQQQQDASPPATTGQPANVLVGTADVQLADSFDGIDANGDAWRYTYRRRNDGTRGWTRIGKTA